MPSWTAKKLLFYCCSFSLWCETWHKRQKASGMSSSCRMVFLVSGEAEHIVHLIRWNLNSNSCLCHCGTTWLRSRRGVTHDFCFRWNWVLSGFRLCSTHLIASDDPLAPSYGIMADPNDFITYGTADHLTYTVYDAYTFTLANSFTDIDPTSGPTSSDPPPRIFAISPDLGLFPDLDAWPRWPPFWSMLHSSWPTMPSSSIPTNSPTLPTFPSTTTAPQVPQPNVPPITPSHPGFPTLTPSGRFETPILSLHQRQPFRRIQDHHLQFHATRLSRPSCPFQFDIIVIQLLPHRPIHHLNQLPPHQCYLHHLSFLLHPNTPPSKLHQKFVQTSAQRNLVVLLIHLLFHRYLFNLPHRPTLHNKNLPPWAPPPRSLLNQFASFNNNSNSSSNPNVYNNTSSRSSSSTFDHYTTNFFSSSLQSQTYWTTCHINFIDHWKGGTTYSHSVSFTFRRDSATSTSPISISPTLSTTFSTSPTSSSSISSTHLCRGCRWLAVSLNSEWWHTVVSNDVPCCQCAWGILLAAEGGCRNHSWSPPWTAAARKRHLCRPSADSRCAGYVLAIPPALLPCWSPQLAAEERCHTTVHIPPLAALGLARRGSWYRPKRWGSSTKRWTRCPVALSLGALLAPEKSANGGSPPPSASWAHVKRPQLVVHARSDGRGAAYASATYSRSRSDTGKSS